MIAAAKQRCLKLGLNWAWGLFNFTLGVSLGAFVGAFVTKVGPSAVLLLKAYILRELS